MRKRIFVLVIMAAPLLSIGTCAQITVESTLGGTFAGLNAALIDEVKGQLGLKTIGG